jgi:hypothetical protein
VDDANGEGIAMVCIRSAWLTLGSKTLPLEDSTKGYFCTSLDLGSPTVRDVVTNRPDQDGADDRTTYLGPRAVSADISAVVGAGARIDAVASMFGPYMAPNVRPVLHYVLDRPGTAERTITLRGSGYAWPVAGPSQRDIQLQWVAADPVIRDPNVQSASGFAGSTAGAGRAYPLNPPRTYPAGTGTASYALVHSYGDLRVWPLIRVYGPVTGPAIKVDQYSGTGWLQQIVFPFVPAFRVDVGHWVDVDCRKRTVLVDSDPNQNAFANVDWSTARWPWVDPDPAYAQVTLTGTNTGSISQVQAFWQDSFLT